MKLFTTLLGASTLLLCSLQHSSAYTRLSDATLQTLPSPGNDFDINTGALLAPILIPRVPGTPGSAKVLAHFVDFFRTALPKWNLEFQNSTSTTPTSAGQEIPFVNLVATRDPPWARPGEVGRLALVAHYDSKLTPAGFIGATDSAAPCAMLMHVARSIDAALTKKWEKMQAEGLADDLEDTKGVRIVLLDGEEAFYSWTETDSLYGARALAESWENTYHSASSTFKTELASLELFLLLDLLGSKDPKVPSYFQTTHWAYKAMAGIEARLRTLGQFKSSPNHHSKRGEGVKPRAEPPFLIDANKQDDNFRSMIEDDHIPFMKRGVEILHMIPSPFPRVWHQIDDDGQNLDLNTVEDWAMLVTAFASEWMELEGFFDANAASKQQEGGGAGNRKRETERSEL
ncbi:uncharacterized protein K452DRAFT_229201 [Aplosporella prunicola CBS 121167]|uniref:Peptide hydrolase n=1 Tax=Aplosporella prunicola CBS 121167 TaxID=1176127 RepID=A0A6A6BA39_9PEZI|nr:uncharacterized protein K452DRAFT_229201 [Aplosporella prunicola CBS 121167]KAF2140940.1 hypothetical protein K452DRAFT_229201 [Aplosporella prunicola CBS 121167]